MQINYLDPGTGAMLISAVVGVFATVVLGFKTVWYKLTSVFAGEKGLGGSPGKSEPGGKK